MEISDIAAVVGQGPLALVALFIYWDRFGFSKRSKSSEKPSSTPCALVAAGLGPGDIGRLFAEFNNELKNIRQCLDRLLDSQATESSRAISSRRENHV